MATVYILYSAKIDKFYTGSCLDFKSRLNQHLNNAFKNSYSSQTNDWKIFFKIEKLEYIQARNIERHIKSMKSRKYILNLKKYPEISEKLIIKYSNHNTRKGSSR